ncbi:carboxylating nicotinate-nucleotide diphosphorylase [Coprothermobacteraceae bacterium]|nr:carboxylating nicotinate-nucleotide diphosphorylase [Coprothermobacteraceae bacterium]
MTGDFGFNARIAEPLVKLALQEDIGNGDITSEAIFKDERGFGFFVVKDDGVVAGLPVVELVYHILDPSISVELMVSEGATVKKGDRIIEVNGPVQSILSGERVALNFLQRMSGIATLTSKFVRAVAPYGVRICDTRKTVPGLRYLDKYAVRVGGGVNHRFGLDDAVLIKDNHIRAAGGVKPAVDAVRRKVSFTRKIEVEVQSLAELDEALEADVDIIMLDNMGVNDLTEAVRRIRSVSPHILIEASGGITLDTVIRVASTGVDLISVGELTHSVRVLDISLELQENWI